MDHRFRRWIGRALLALGLAAIGQPCLARDRCADLKDLRLPKVEIVSAMLVPAGIFASAAPTVAGAAPVALAAHCTVRAVARPTGDSAIGIEIWLPARGWNGRYEQVGNGGWAGAIHARPLADAVRRGYAAAATDDGHQDGIGDDGHGRRSAEFAIGHREKLIDFGYRALGETQATARAVIRAYYRRDAAHSYFVGCSDGGREALMVAQRFPDAFDGILAGNPGNDWSHWAAGQVWNEQAQEAGSPGAIPIAKRAAIQNAVLAACDAIDGVRDGLIANPRFCRFDPAILACKGADADDCLTAPQVIALRRLYDGPRNPRTGARIFPGFPPGIENAPGSALITPAQPGAFSFGDTYFGQAVFGQVEWDFRSLDFDRDIARSDREGAPIVDAVDPDLRAFRAHGGKLIHYHGWSDALIPPAASIAYYERVAAFLRDDGVSIDGFYRLFLIPGMGHCYGGAGPTAIAPANAAQAADPHYDPILSLVRWVEQGIAPDLLIGSGTAPTDPARTMARPICPYPQTARYRGTGDPDDAASFACVVTPRKGYRS